MRTVKGLIGGAAIGLVAFLAIAISHYYIWQRYYN